MNNKELLFNQGSTNECQSENQGYTFTILRLFITWVKIGFTSFGGGPVTQYLIQENFIYKYKWINSEEYAHIIAISQVAPGINILSYTILIGRRLAGWKGISVSLLGLILPSAAVTIGISAAYANIGKYPRVHSAFNTGFAAIFGISLATNWRNAKPILEKNRKRGLLPLFIAIGIMAGSILIYIFINPNVIVLYLLGGLCGAFSYWYFTKKGGNTDK
jgi:chromate transporter